MKKRLSALVLCLLASFTVPMAVQAVAAATNIEVYEIDSSHSSIKFSIRHFIAKTTGSFGQFSGTLQIDRADLTRSSINAQIELPSVHTNSEKRDEHLQQDDYFDAKQYPVMVFESTQWLATAAEQHFKVVGDLTLRGMTHSVVLDVELLGFGAGARGAYLSGWEAKTVLDRTLWGIDGGQPAVGTEVEVEINIEAVRR
jgi:polyisoprenoid-binding protein YceI